jgi:hypothetical protein
MHRSRAPSIAPGTFFVAQPWADCITNMPGFKLRQALANGLDLRFHQIHVSSRWLAAMRAAETSHSPINQQQPELT